MPPLLPVLRAIRLRGRTLPCPLPWLPSLALLLALPPVRLPARVAVAGSQQTPCAVWLLVQEEGKGLFTVLVLLVLHLLWLVVAVAVRTMGAA